MLNLKSSGPLNLSASDTPLIYKLFESVVEKSPHAIAAIYKTQELTYSELHLQSTRLANFLVRAGVKPGTIIGLCVDCDLNLLVGILGIMKAGGAYFPLDPAYPRERFRYMLEDANPSLILTVSRYTELFNGYRLPTVFLDFEEDRIQASGDGPVRVEIHPEDLAYLIYTSGSTGKPKGIMIPHRSLPLAAVSRRQLYPSRMRGLVTGSICFDVSLITIFHTLADGGAVCLPGPSAIVDAEATIKLLQEKSIDYMMCVPSFYALLLEKKKAMPSLKVVSLGGESIPRHIPALHRQYAHNASLFNEYGPSEWAMGTTIAKIVDPVKNSIEPITIGNAHPGAEIYLLDEHFRLVPEGEKGEIFIAGDGLAIAYMNRPELTAEKFLSLPIEGKNVRVYRTGDFARRLSNGSLDYLGRIDNQVKIRGFRIELGEVENVVCQYPSTQEAAVLAKEDGKGSLRIIAYYTASHAIDEGEIKQFLLQRLPPAAIPFAFIQMDRFERTPNGKIDRASLPAPQIRESSVSSNGKIAPQTKLERDLAAAWKSVLGKEEIGVNENFFDIGGDSLSLAALQTAMASELNLPISIVDLFQYPTIGQIARHLSLQTTDFSVTNGINKRQAFLKFKAKAGK